MSQQQKDALKEMISEAPLDIGGDVIEQRANFERMLSARPLADDVSTAPRELGAIPALSIETGEPSHHAVVLWFHGGWYAIGSILTSAELSSDLARRIDAKVISVDYRLAQEHPYPAALQDPRAACRGLVDSDTDPRSIAIVGESAGGGLAVALLASLAEAGLAQPACAVAAPAQANQPTIREAVTEPA
jgi:acetyl esterase/lipase